MLALPLTTANMENYFARGAALNMSSFNSSRLLSWPTTDTNCSDQPPKQHPTTIKTTVALGP